MLRLAGKKTEHLDGEGGPADIYNCPLVTKPYRDSANVDKLKMLNPLLRASTTVTTNLGLCANFFTTLKAWLGSKSHICRCLQ
jgi:hypothetical protein